MIRKDEMVWSYAFSIGNEKIDSDHKRIIGIYNESVELRENFSSIKFAEILSKMTDYSLYHFKREEEYMKKFSYTDLEAHKVFHKNFIYKVSMYNANFFTSNHPDPEEVIYFLHNWWKNHILKKDKEYELYKINNGLIADY